MYVYLQSSRASKTLDDALVWRIYTYKLRHARILSFYAVESILFYFTRFIRVQYKAVDF